MIPQSRSCSSSNLRFVAVPEATLNTMRWLERDDGHPTFSALWGGAEPSLPRRAIITSVDLMIASASSPRRNFNAVTASAVMTAVSVWSPTRKRTWPNNPSTRTSSMNP